MDPSGSSAAPAFCACVTGIKGAMGSSDGNIAANGASGSLSKAGTRDPPGLTQQPAVPGRPKGAQSRRLAGKQTGKGGDFCATQ